MNKYLISVGSDICKEAEDFYASHWNCLSNRKEDFQHKKNTDTYYRGDVIITAKTFLGEDDWRLNKAIVNSNCSEKDAEELKTLSVEYRKIGNTLANFMPLWRLGSTVKANLNMAKGSWAWNAGDLDRYRDSQDLWLKDVKKWYMKPNALKELTYKQIEWSIYDLFESNAKNYFDKFISSSNDLKENWKNYIDKNYLMDFVDEKYNVVDLFEGEHCPKSGILEVSQIRQFLCNAIRIIKSRADKLMKETQTKEKLI